LTPAPVGPPRAGRFISFEGIDGCGKSSQARLLAAHLGGPVAGVVLTREPGGSAGAEDIRRLLVEGAPGRWSPETEILLFTAARRDHWERTIAPALAAGRTVITDRFADSTRVYQGVARGDLRDLVDRLHAMLIGADPDLTLIIDVAPDIALARADGRADGENRFETFGLDFQRRLRAGFLALAEAEPHRIRVIDGDGTPETVAARVAAESAAA